MFFAASFFYDSDDELAWSQLPVWISHFQMTVGKRTNQIHVNISLAVITKTELQNFPKSASDNFQLKKSNQNQSIKREDAISGIGETSRLY